MTPELAAEQAAATLKTAAAWANDPEAVSGFVQIADAWTRLHTALATAPKTIEPATPDEHRELGIDKIIRRNEQLKRAAGLECAPPLTLPPTADQSPRIRVMDVDYEVDDWSIEVGFAGVGSIVLQLTKVT
jgi:hypothetical protein